MTIKIVLVEPSVQGNIGATARVMKNFGFQELVLINPQTDISGDVYR
ncbi:MAG: TrmH family RNA methyltransferase, partial [Candidatus Heimdallarchaeota archaeon]